MRTYYYTPSTYVYAAVVGKDGAMTYYDLTEDVVSCTVNRNTDDASSANVTLLNRGWKYNDVFTPFDMIAVFASKGSDKIRLFTGYMTTVTKFTLYEQNFTIEAKDIIHRLSRLWFDPHIMATTNLMSDEYSRLEGWNNASEMWKLLTVIGGVSENQIKIAELPTGAMEWARKLYVAQKADYEQSEQIVEDMFSAIMSSSVVMSGVAAADAAGSAAMGVLGSDGNGFVAMKNGKLTVAEKIAQVAEHFADHNAHGYSQPNRGTGGTEVIKLSDGTSVTISSSDVDCSEMARQCVCCALTGSWTSPIGYMWTGDEDEKLRSVGFARMDYSESIVRRGDVLWVSGHTGVAIGNGMQADAHGSENPYNYKHGERGDQTETEVNKRSLRSWTYIYRYAGAE